MQTQDQVLDQAQRCRRLAATINDERARAVLIQMAEEHEAKAKIGWTAGDAGQPFRDLRWTP